MNMNLLVAAVLGSTLSLTACGKKEQAPTADQASSAVAEAPVTAEQQAIIAELDQPSEALEAAAASEAHAEHE